MNDLFETLGDAFRPENIKKEMPDVNDFLKATAMICNDYERANNIPKETLHIPSMESIITINKN